MRTRIPFHLSFAFDHNDGDEKINFDLTVDGNLKSFHTYRLTVDTHFGGNYVLFGVMAFARLYLPDEIS